MTSEQILLRRARLLEEDALAEIYDRYSDELYRYAIRLLGDMQLSEDCVMDTFSRFLRVIHRGGGPEYYLRAYLYRIAHNWITDSYRRQATQEEPLDLAANAASDLDPGEALQEKFDRELVQKGLLTLTPDQRFVITLKFLEGWSNEEIAEALGKQVGAVKALQHRGIQSLQRALRTKVGKTT